ncbi:MAG: hypothetical protein LBD28_01625 [Tannerellaceae bacterium]|jgi:hypothetical protein|nr:hypothetical protein [Tannerellaceae bacterium]
MAKQIKLQDYVAYRKKLSEIVVDLDEMAELIYTCMVDLAISGKLKDLAEKHPHALESELTEDMVLEAGDKYIDALGNILDAMYDAIEIFSTEADNTDNDFPPEELPF